MPFAYSLACPDNLMRKSTDPLPYPAVQVSDVVPAVAHPQQQNDSHSRFNALLESTFSEVRKLSRLKGGEYAGDVDRLANFRRNGAAAETTMELIWRVYASKHWDALMQYELDLRTNKTRDRLESISGRIDDLILYLLLFKLMFEERGNAAPAAAA